jgi:outer membrane protein assembly factor BamA
MRIVVSLTAMVLALALMPARPALAIGEVITDIRVRDNARTEEETIRSIAGIAIGDTMELTTLEVVRERLHTSGLFADVNVYWEAYKDGVRVNIVIKDKFPWAPVPTFSYAPGNTSAGLVIGHGNLFGRGKRGLIGGRISTADSGAVLAYQDPALFGSWVFYEFVGRFQDQNIPEYANTEEQLPPNRQLAPVRETKLRSYGFGASVGIAWFRRVKTSVGWNIDRYKVRDSQVNMEAFPEAVTAVGGDWAAEDGLRANAEATLTFDFRAREHAVMWGNALSFGFDRGGGQWGGDPKFDYWKARVSYEHGFRFLRRHNFIVRAAGFIGHDLPFWSENWAGGTNLRGYLYRQFAGDTQARGQAEYHFPLFSVGKLDVRGLLFCDSAAIWYRELPELEQTRAAYIQRDDGRRFLPQQYLRAGFDRNRDIHTSVGGGIRFFLRSVAIPLVGVDVGYGLGQGPVRVLLVLGA